MSAVRARFETFPSLWKVPWPDGSHGLRGIAVAGVAVIAAGGGLTALGLGLQDRSSAADRGGSHIRPLTTQQVDDAVVAAHWAEDHYGPDTITGATAISIDGSTVPDETGNTCPPGPVVQVSVYGSFPHIITSGRVILKDGAAEPGQGLDVSRVIVMLDDAGARCLSGVATGTPSTPPGARLLFGQAP